MAKPPVRAQELATQLALQIRSGELAAGSWLPAERQLAESHRVGRSTARAALQTLAELGLVRLVPGSGAQVLAWTDLGEGDVRDALDRINDQLVEINQRLARLEASTVRTDSTA